MWLRRGSNCKVGRKHHYVVAASTAWPGSQLLPNNTMNQDWASAEGAVRAQPPLHHCLQRWLLYIYCAADRSWTCPLVPHHNHACRKFIALVCQRGRQRLELLLHSSRAWFLAKSGDFLVEFFTMSAWALLSMLQLPNTVLGHAKSKHNWCL